MARRRTRFALSLVLAASLLLASAGFAQAVTVIKATSTRHWNPASATVSKGTKVVWKNPTTLTHTVTAYKGNWSKNATLSSGGHTSFLFSNTGTFKYRCTIHSTLSNGVCSGMCGKVVVT
ncbi:MAG: Copper binding protein plastocyanin/azurin family [Actinomycetota bacterium]|jgi:plastocyanin|nr:Copper binding protein plastocyanin/azurin family [Actinomycetota bacterium]